MTDKRPRSGGSEVHAMIDLETLGLGPAPVIVQIGAVIFDPRAMTDADAIKAGSEFVRPVDPKSCVEAGLKMDPSTVVWWLQQSHEAIRSVFDPAQTPWTLDGALCEFSNWCRSHGVTKLWSHGAASDFPWLEAAYRAVGLAMPVNHRAPRDTRTLFDLAEEIGWSYDHIERHGVHHDALADAIFQARCVASARRTLGRLIG